ncbi:single-stranded DNA-binding protein [Accumulibacter sp.]|uniref:single-stranded DNA-binding protein n=1 Tax=Accumulibacter sp. TaxID=2053492 RepID=UPI0025FE5AFE|nr:single-stranded DNA-binding protein [Accumulibacter sp.]MCM8594207.1 single-stranded DNA-binding protein [Accumulibacter sp.]MCM8625772.1 single-stranded DNA-binding protein [Accumulibacter sp.]MDS4048350.1 single-stranded DNA-binding protein [Accumulibacter sp.]
MASVNKVILVGNLGADPETRYLSSGDAVCNIRIATTDRIRDKNSGEYRENTEWHRIVFFGKLAETAGQYLKKGRQVYVEGRIRTNKWQDKDGNERYTTEIIANDMKMLGSREGLGAPASAESEYGGAMPSSSAGGAGSSRPTPAKKTPSFEDMDDDIPF